MGYPRYLSDVGTAGKRKEMPPLIKARELKRLLSAIFNYLTGVNAWLGFLSETKEALEPS